ncbi:MAG: exodeoxyribonuclease VII small subunit [Cyanobacteriota bacterium]|nr:exodeoxyribonuclease VII small subunit [Cyanobacteriota bacterium]
MPKRNSSPIPTPWHYETAIQEVEGIITQIESGALDLGEVVSQFERASQTLRDCEAFLHAKQAQVDLIIETLTGQPESASQPPTLQQPIDPAQAEEDMEF